jgi:hypothetical protein
MNTCLYLDSQSEAPKVYGRGATGFGWDTVWRVEIGDLQFAAVNCFLSFSCLLFFPLSNNTFKFFSLF